MAPIAQSGPFWAQKCSFLAQNQFFLDILQLFCYHHDGTPKRQLFCVDRIAGQAPGGVEGLNFGPKLARKSDFFTLHPYNLPFLGSDGRDSMGS